MVKRARSSEINNQLLKDEFLKKELSQKIELKKEIIIDRIDKKIKRYQKRNNLHINRIKSINNSLLKIANKDKKLYSLIVKKFGNKGLGI